MRNSVAPLNACVQAVNVVLNHGGRGVKTSTQPKNASRNSSKLSRKLTHNPHTLTTTNQTKSTSKFTEITDVLSDLFTQSTPPITKTISSI